MNTTKPTSKKASTPETRFELHQSDNGKWTVIDLQGNNGRGLIIGQNLSHAQAESLAEQTSAPETRKGFKETSAEMIMRLCEDINKLTAQHDELLAACKRASVYLSETDDTADCEVKTVLDAAIAKADKNQ